MTFSFLDPNTVNWLKRNLNTIFGFPEIVRFSWSSCSRILDELAVPVNWNDPVGEDETGSSKKRPASASISSKQSTEKKERNIFSAYKCKSLTEI